MQHLIAPSLLSADFANLRKEVEMLNQSEADFLHLDIMDGVFVPNLSFGIPVVKAIKKHSTKPLDVHLMIVDPDRYIEDFARAGADWLTVHFEACTHLHRVIGKIKSAGMKAGVALNPHSTVSLLADIIQDVDLLLIMSVNPGFGGQRFIEHTYHKISQARRLITDNTSQAFIEIDGGVDLMNYRKLLEAGANILVAGNTVFGSPNPPETISRLKNLY